MKTLFQNCDILISENGIHKTLKNAFLGVDESVICYIGNKKPVEKYDVIKNYQDKLLMPGLYNCHTHSPMVLLRGIGNDKPLHTWLYDYIFPLESKLTAEQIKTASYLAIMEMIASGTVSFTDMYFYPEVTARAVEASGIKANLTRHIQFTAEHPDAIDKSLQFFKEYNGMAKGRIKADFSIHSLYTCEKESAEEYTEICNKNGGRMHIHLAETQKEYDDCIKQNGVTPAEWFEDIGALNSRTSAAHCVFLSPSDKAKLAQSGVNVVHCPTSNLKLGSGFAPIPELIEKGINVTLGTDSAASNNNLNMFEEMHIASIIHNGRLLESTIMNTDTVLNMVSINGAKAQGREDCGELKVGKRADIIAIDMDKPHLQTAADACSLITYSAQSSDVCLNMIDGKIIYENGEYLSIDKEKTIYNAKQILNHLY